jgi:hypothetical protein
MIKIIQRAVLLLAGCTVCTVALASFSDSGTLTKEMKLLCKGGNGVDLRLGFGYENGEFGTYSPTGVAGGENVTGIFDIVSTGTCVGGSFAELTIAGFSSSPGRMWLISVTCNGVERTQTAAAGFSYASGTAAWSWSTPFGFSSLGNGSQFACTIVHN